MKKIIFILLLSGLCINEGFSTVYYACGTGIVWDGSTSFVYTSTDCTTGGPVNPNTLTSADEMIIQAGAVVLVEGNVTLNAIKLTVYGTLFIGTTPGISGKLTLPNNSATIVFQLGSFLGCSADGIIAVPCVPSNSQQIIVGSGGSKYIYNGDQIDQVNGFPKPVTLDNIGGPLPIELLSFKAYSGLNKISISWATASELNFDFFDIEKSSDGANFYSIAKVKGNGTTNIRQDYFVNDEKPLNGKNYYRLKSVDFDGYTEYFNVIMVDFEGKNNFSVYPNPSDGITLNIETNFISNSNSFVSIYSTTGVEIARFKVGGNVTTLTLPAKLESGLYFAKYISSELTSTSILVVK